MPAVMVPLRTGTAPAMAGSGKQHPGLAGPSPAEGFSADSGGLLFKQVTPRRRQDQFGRDNTRHADYLLSMAVFPTGVRAPLLSDLQRKTEHQCGFEVIDKGTERASSRHVHIQDSKPPPDSSRRGSATDSAKKPPPNTPLTGSVKLSSDRATHHSQSFSVPPSSRRSLSREKRRWAYSSAEGTRSSSLGGGEKKTKDIRDPMYINTYCPDERKLRYKKSTLPRLSSRTRPWTVSEPNPSYRFAQNSQQLTSSEKLKGKAEKSAWSGQGVNFRIDARDVMARAKGRASGQIQSDIDGEESEDTESMTGSQALLEVKSYFPGAGDGVLGDQRDSLRGRQGCLHAKVKQCIKFVKYREKLARTLSAELSAERPLKSENGRYRPFSTTTIRTPRGSAPTSSPAPRHPDPISVEIYKEYIDTIALQTRLVSAADKRRKPRPAVSGLPRNNTAASSYQESVLQSVSDSNRPTPSNASAAADKSASATTRPSESSQHGNALPTSESSPDKDPERGREPPAGSDPRGVHHALDIIRLSPKAQPPRSSRTSRGGRATHREEKETAGEGEGGRKGADGEEEGKAKTHAIILPNVTKSATSSVCSFMDESVNAAES